MSAFLAFFLLIIISLIYSPPSIMDNSTFVHPSLSTLQQGKQPPFSSSILPVPNSTDPVPLPLVISHQQAISANPDQIRRVLASNTVPRLVAAHQQCCWPKSPRLRCCLCSIAILPAILLFILFALVWLNELRLI